MTRSIRRAVCYTLAAAPFAGTAAYAAPVYDPANNVTYVRDATVRTWADARAAAQAAGGDLARVRSAGANEAIRAVSAGGGWIGATDQAAEGDWRWTVGNAQFWQGLAADNPTTPGMPVGGLYTNWNGGEPNDSGNEDFAEIVGSGGWNDLPGSATRASVREVPGNQAGQTFNGRVYTLIAADTWANAQTRAQAMGGNLVRIDDAAENAFVAGLLTGTGGVSAWIGGSDQAAEGDWRWVDGNDPFWSGLANGMAVNGRYTNWNAGEPNDSNGEDFAEIQASGGWNDLPAGFTRLGVVEVVPEPASLGLLGLGALGLLARRRRPA